MKLTRRGKIVIPILIALATFLAVMIAFNLMSSIIGAFEYIPEAPQDHIRCVAGTVLQSDGSCTPQE